jgi:hypothetical protein
MARERIFHIVAKIHNRLDLLDTAALARENIIQNLGGFAINSVPLNEYRFPVDRGRRLLHFVLDIMLSVPVMEQRLAIVSPYCLLIRNAGEPPSSPLECQTSMGVEVLQYEL